jgi:D-beta-D-heptose 7-phosphate kinase/D-beta-D-heptose 1-phosphate adenosyltransferase
MEYIRKIKKITEINGVINKSESKIICCCGCFDIFHVGHLEHLTESKKFGDVLIVGVNSDNSYLELKKKKPIFNVIERMSLLAALECVDYVFSFEETTFCNSLLALKPHVFTTGIDHKQNHMDEEDTCRVNKIIFKYTGDKKRASSSILVHELRDNKDVVVT